jgi:hypothetical protein
MPNIIPDTYTEKYGRSGSCGDEVAEALAAYVKPDGKKVDVDRMTEVARANSVPMERWSSLNTGQKRMLLGNVLRRKIREGVRVTIGELVFNEPAAA